MSREHLLEAIGLLDDDLIREAEEYRRSRRNYRPWISLAACLVVVLALVYLLYQHERVLSTVMLSGAMFSVWLRSASANSSIWRLPVMIGCIAAAAVVVAVLFLVFRVQKDGGKLLGVQVFSSECDYRVLYGVLGIAAAALLLAAAVSVTAYYLLWALAVLLFAELVFYTTKLM